METSFETELFREVPENDDGAVKADAVLTTARRERAENFILFYYLLAS
jgi:hypothetical protein